MSENLIDGILNIKQEMVDEYKRTVEINEYKKNYGIMVDMFAKNVIDSLKRQCDINMKVFKYPFHLNMKRECLLNIGYPYPKDYINELEQYYCDIFLKNNYIENSIVKVEIIPIEYSKSGKNIIKKVNDYCLKLELVECLKKDKVKTK